ncbi:leguminosin proline-rich group669 secreted peptide [Medicago truncatula]|uniref:Leguminosin proline-rich group669 secreted peptide n=1 Tax=Medicago truncatula TaxID=3880 RepID=A0A072TRR9_MEDTR|nr:leguminosin proline-rich group669 secreted peptide [Medicago truncatula]
MSHLISVLVLLLAIITLTSAARNINPKYESARSNGFISYQPPTTDTQKLVGLNHRRRRHLAPPPPPKKPPPIHVPGTPQRQPHQHPIRPPPKM